MEKLVVVNGSDQILGMKEKLACHLRPETLHRWFAAFILDDTNRLLLSKRSRKKPLWPLSWDNSCSSHPYLGESYRAAGERRIAFELGFRVPLRHLYKFKYQADYNDRLAEHEVCVVLVGRYSGAVKPNPEEVSQIRWVSLPKLIAEIAKEPSVFTPWLRIAVEKIQADNTYRQVFDGKKGGEQYVSRKSRG